jgi:6-phosphofructokinase
MTKNKRNPNVWTNTDVESDPDGYKEAQANYREDREEQQRKVCEDFDLRTFVSEFVRRGGTKEAAERAYTDSINREAAEAAEAANAEAAAYQRRKVRSVL